MECGCEWGFQSKFFARTSCKLRNDFLKFRVKIARNFDIILKKLFRTNYKENLGF